MTPSAFRRIALTLPDSAEVGHMGHPDFRVGGKIFATLFTRDGLEWGMVKLKPDQQREFIKKSPDAFSPASGAWGRRGATEIRLSAIDQPTLKDALFTAWLNTAPKKLINELGFDVK